MASMEDLYQDIILDHNKRPRNHGPLPEATHKADGRNPLCGDELKVSLRVTDSTIADVRFQGQGCAISKASASLMTEALKGKSVEQARRFSDQIVRDISSPVADWKFEEMGDLAALSGVRKFPARIKCATLAWHACMCALEGGESISTEHDDAAT